MENTQLTNATGNDDSKHTLLLVGGIALVVFGAGVVLSSPVVRRYLGNMRVGTLIGAAFPDIDRYMKMRAM